MGRVGFATFTVFVACVAIACAALGAWQLQRHYWKAGLLRDAAAAAASAPIAFPADQDDLLANRPYDVSGRFLIGHDIPMRGYAFEGVSGTRMFAPFELEDGRILIIQRGWVARGREGRLGIADDSPQTLTLLWRPYAGTPGRHRLFSPVNAPELGIWAYVDPAAMAAFWGLQIVQSGHGELRGPEGAGQGARIEPFQADLFNAHLEYVATWWSMGGIILLVYGWVWRDRKRKMKT